jgi:hypothetical protein
VALYELQSEDRVAGNWAEGSHPLMAGVWRGRLSDVPAYALSLRGGEGWRGWEVVSTALRRVLCR